MAKATNFLLIRRFCCTPPKKKIFFITGDLFFRVSDFQESVMPIYRPIR